MISNSTTEFEENSFDYWDDGEDEYENNTFIFDDGLEDDEESQDFHRLKDSKLPKLNAEKICYFFNSDP